MVNNRFPMKKLFLFTVALVVTVLLGYTWYANALGSVDGGEGRVQLTIEPGTSVSGIAGALHAKNLVSSPLAFKLYAKFHGLEGKLQAGNFVFQKPVSVAEIADILQSGKTQEISVTIPEGFTVSDIDALLVRRGLTETGAVLDCARTCDFSSFDFLPTRSGLAERGGKVEGYLYPDTYFVATDSFSVEAFLKRLLTTFEARIVDEYAAEITASGRPLHDIVTMASLIEEEAITEEERPVIAGILWKRFDAGQGLGVDATVRYILNKPSADITLQDLNVNSPYNTRKFRGLPPGPIANSGIESIEAALQPEDSPYWYYLHDPTGRIHYAETNEAHNLNRIRYL
jgi:UPF0755 protein